MDIETANERVDESIEQIGTKSSSKDDREFKGSAPKYVTASELFVFGLPIWL